MCSAPWLTRHHDTLSQRLSAIRGGDEIPVPQFIHGDIVTYDLPTASADVITCCGSVLSFVDSYDVCIRKMANALRPGPDAAECAQSRAPIRNVSRDKDPR